MGWIAADLDVSPEEAVRLYRQHGTAGLIRHDPDTGEPYVVPPEASG